MRRGPSAYSSVVVVVAVSPVWGSPVVVTAGSAGRVRPSQDCAWRAQCVLSRPTLAGESVDFRGGSGGECCTVLSVARF